MCSIRDYMSDEKEETDVVFIVRLLHRTLSSVKYVYVHTLEHRIRTKYNSFSDKNNNSDINDGNTFAHII
jgi:hypothetical protein